MKKIIDKEVSILATHAQTLREEYVKKDDAWEGSPFAWIAIKKSRQIGAIGEKLVSGYLATKGFDVVRSPDSDADRIINGVRAEIKFSTLWENGVYKFQQLRDQNYEFVICLGASPFDAHCWVIPKKAVMDLRGKAEGLAFQHGGASGRDTAWLTVTPGQEPDWLAPYGGNLGAVSDLLEKITGKKRLE